MSGDALERRHPDSITALVTLSKTLRIIAADHQLEHAPEIRQQITNVATALERIFSIDECGDFDSVSDVDARSNVPVNAKIVGKAFAYPARSATGGENAKQSRKRELKAQARALYDAEPGGRPLSNEKRTSLKLQFLELGVVDSTARRWLNEFDGPSRR